MRKKSITCFITILCLLAVTPFSSLVATEIGQPAPSFVVNQLDGKSFDLSAHKGKIVLIHFWATWCASCKEEMPILNVFYQRHHAEGLEVLAVSIDKSRQRDTVQKAINAFHFPGALLGDADRNGFGQPMEIPLTYIIDTKGIVQAKLIPQSTPLSEQILEITVKTLLPH